ncbi:CPBP family intramembrane glutamic endopeptidase [Microbacterium wangchenii]|uniref:CPBP family intramembrane glutamic endopeptidase n=1 Tax=Microbacterium wangchenii TaxID=2541726 RepID=UPI0011CA0249|nr:type II CAAX endopeptidase family protein [Microbacterium wangchenii]TXK16050.1 CPBP family intramembrane metalloprotease [Microbacterium wangchenii]
MTESTDAARRDLLLPDVEFEAQESPAERPRRPRSPRRRRTWVEGGTSVQHWGWELLGWAVLALGAGLVAGAALNEFLPQPLGSTLSLLALWVAFAVPVLLAFRRSVPRALLRFRPLDLLYALALGILLRIVQGWLDMAAGGTGAWPSYPTAGGALPSGWLFDELVAATVVGPVLEEFFFRGLILVAAYTAVRRLAGRGVAGFAATLVSTGLFVAAHALLVPAAWDQALSLALVGIVASLLVLLTGRIWAAVLMHVVYNGLWVALATVGTLLGGSSGATLG